MFISKLSLGKLAFLSFPAVCSRLLRGRDDDDDEDDDDEDETPGWRGWLKRFVKGELLSNLSEKAKTFFWIYLKMQVQELGGNIKIENLTMDEIRAKADPDERSEDFTSKAVVWQKKHPDHGQYVIVNFREDVDHFDIFLMASFKGWKRTTPEEAMSVYRTRPSASLMYNSDVVCLGMVVNRPSANVLAPAIPYFGFEKSEKKKNKKKDQYEVGLHSLESSFCDSYSFLFRV